MNSFNLKDYKFNQNNANLVANQNHDEIAITQELDDIDAAKSHKLHQTKARSQSNSHQTLKNNVESREGNNSGPVQTNQTQNNLWMDEIWHGIQDEMHREHAREEMERRIVEKQKNDEMEVQRRKELERHRAEARIKKQQQMNKMEHLKQEQLRDEILEQMKIDQQRRE